MRFARRMRRRRKRLLDLYKSDRWQVSWIRYMGERIKREAQNEADRVRRAESRARREIIAQLRRDREEFWRRQESVERVGWS